MIALCRHLAGRHAAPLACMAALLAGCATAPGPAPLPERPAEARDTTPPAPPAAPRSTARRGGGYYQDDGPDDHPPDGLDRVPDAEPRAEPLHRFANNPYNVLGQAYTPVQEVAPFRQRGIASWYGRKFHGKRTSSGEPYDMYGMTAAHPTLPIPSYARVTRVATGRSVIVRINDRGPFHARRAIDLSYTAAHKLGYIGQGSAEVEIEQIVPEGIELMASRTPPARPRGRGGAGTARMAVAAPAPVTPPVVTPAASPRPPLAADTGDPLLALADGQAAGAAPPAATVSLAETASRMARTGVFLQLGAFTTAANAEGFRALVLHELDWLADRLDILAQGGRFRLHAGPFASDAEARRAAQRIGEALRLKPFVIVR